ncbi:MAG: ATP-binding protein [Myxococcales bacterium]|nr:ATP-binding protein [Myxococcales bacterium]
MRAIQRSNTARAEAPLPRWFLASVVAITIGPFLLNLVGVDFSSRPPPTQPDGGLGLSGPAFVDYTIRSLSGLFVHTLLEWTAVLMAAFTAVLAFAHFRVNRDVVTPVIGVALLSAGTVDAFHTLAADRLIRASAENQHFVPFTWALSRTFSAVIPLTALVLIFFVRKHRPGDAPRQSSRVIAISALLLGALAYGLIHVCASSPSLPRTMYPDSFVTRPWDVAPLVAYAVSAFCIYPLFNRQAPSHFAKALWLSVIPDLATQLHMAFGSAALFDNHFNIAHLLKITAYAVPCVGLMLDYIATRRMANDTARASGMAEIATGVLHNVGNVVNSMNVSVALTREKTERTAVDLLERLVMLLQAHDGDASARARFLTEDPRGKQVWPCLNAIAKRLRKEQASLHEELESLQEHVDHISAIVGSQQEYARSVPVLEETPLAPVLDKAILLSGASPSSKGIHIERSYDDERIVRVDVHKLMQILVNLLTNARHAVAGNAPGDRRIEVRIEPDAHASIAISVSDNGGGIAPGHLARLFDHGFTTKADGHGFGLHISATTAAELGGRLSARSEGVGEGATFQLSLPASDAKPRAATEAAAA